MKTIKKNLKWITLIVVMIIVTGGFCMKHALESNKFNEVLVDELELDNENIIEKTDEISNEIEDVNNDMRSEMVTEKKVFVDIKGAVRNPGVYEIGEDKKVIDVLELAGGLTENANTSMINLAKKVFNEMVVIIYTNEEVKNANQPDTVIKVVEKECVCPEIKNDACLSSSDTKKNDDQENTETNRKVNINKATLEELLTISGIGESKAKAIIEYREQNGEFKKIEDIMEVSGIGESLYEKIKSNITI